jgi:GT2 family glycosyltransferase
VTRPSLIVSAVVPATNGPATLGRCLHAIRVSVDPPDEVVVVTEPLNEGPARARNAGARRAEGDVLVFVDADVEVQPDVFRRIRTAFAAEDAPTAIFGSYDDDPPAPGLVSSFRNLLHHHVHQQGAGAAETFWAGLGAIRRESFEAAGGFDERFSRPSIEDVELWLRLARSGAAIRLDPELQGTHLKAWSLADMVRTDFLRRGVPWVMLLLETRALPGTLNLGWRHRWSAAAAVVLAAAAVRRRPVTAAGALLVFVGLNASFYELLLRRRGVGSAAGGVGLHLLHHLCGVAAVPAGTAAYVVDRARSACSST